MLRAQANRSIKYGFAIHRQGRHVRRAGLGIGVAGIGAAVLHAGASYVGSGGRFTDVHPNLRRAAQELGQFSRLHASPAMHFVREKYGAKIAGATKAGVENIRRFVSKSPRLVRGAQRLTAFGVRHDIPGKSLKALGAGAAVAALGYGVQRIGQGLLQHGFQSHPGRLRRRVSSFFLG